ncbi:MAG: iron-containing alcohol dehydrogenase [Nitrospiraceae bacterium]|nr:iron-containing alcohol dehydrogenase [Nitrospiraceae bacterium]
MYKAPSIESGAGAAAKLKDLQGDVLAVTMPIPWKVFQAQCQWEPRYVHMVADMDQDTLESLEASAPPFDVVVGLGGGSCCDTAKYLAWKRGCPMVLAPSIVSVDAPLTNMIAVRVDKSVTYVGDIFPEELIVDYDLIRKAPKELNRAGAADIASIHTALYDWALARDERGEAYDATAAQQARACLEELDRNASDVYEVSPKGIDTIVDLYRREVEFCAHLGSSRPEEGAEHLVAYNMEHLTRRHFVHGDLVALGLFTMSRLQDNQSAWIAGLMDRIGLRYRVPEVTAQEVAECLITLTEFTRWSKTFYSVVDSTPITADFVDETVAALFS